MLVVIFTKYMTMENAERHVLLFLCVWFVAGFEVDQGGEGKAHCFYSQEEMMNPNAQDFYFSSLYSTFDSILLTGFISRVSYFPLGITDVPEVCLLELIMMTTHHICQ